MSDTDHEVDWWERIATLRWQHVVLIVAAMAALVVMTFAGPMCSLKIHTGNDTPPTTVAR